MPDDWTPETTLTRCVACGLKLQPGDTHPEPICRLICAARDLTSAAPPAWAWDSLTEAVVELELREMVVEFVGAEG